PVNAARAANARPQGHVDPEGRRQHGGDAGPTLAPRLRHGTDVLAVLVPNVFGIPNRMLPGMGRVAADGVALSKEDGVREAARDGADAVDAADLPIFAPPPAEDMPVASVAG